MSTKEIDSKKETSKEGKKEKGEETSKWSSSIGPRRTKIIGGSHSVGPRKPSE